jgi:hypothetical protein
VPDGPDRLDRETDAPDGIGDDRAFARLRRTLRAIGRTVTSSDRLVRTVRRVRTAVRQFAGAGPIHRRRLDGAELRIAVAGVRGKSTAVEWLRRALSERGHRTYAKVTGVEPTSIVDGFRFPVSRSEPVRLYENEREVRRFAPFDAAVIENQGIRDYTTRLVNEQFVRPHIVFLTNVREDHLDTLGASRRHVARSLARAVPDATTVVCGEQDPDLREKLTVELDRRDAPVHYVEIPDEHRHVPGAEIAFGVDETLRRAGERPLTDRRIQSHLTSMRPEWRHLPEGRVFDAAAANDVQSTELLRRALVADGEVIQPIVRLRADRRGRSASFLRYLNRLAAEGAIERVRVLGSVPPAFVRRADFEVLVHDDVAAEGRGPREGNESDRDRSRDRSLPSGRDRSESDATGAGDAPAADGEVPDAVAVLDTALADGWPVVLMGNTVPDDVKSIRAAIDRRVAGGDREADASGAPGATLPPSDDTHP